MEKKELTQQQSLALINTMIHKARESYGDTGRDSIMWGVVITICSLVKFCEIQFGFKLPFDIYLLTIVAAIFQVVMAIKDGKKSKVKKYDDAFLSPAWIGFGVCIGLLIHIINLLYINYMPMYNEYVNVTGHKPAFNLGEYITPLFLMLYGLPTFITGMGCNFKPMLIGSIICWLCCIITVYTNYKADLLLTALSAIVAWFIPGLWMLSTYKKHKKSQEVLNV
ncbi:MAG TPA: hypothetical protein PK504_07610 [Ferruginibacter sp.]|nr:hypothetical protein [Ferruginibacter sp.]HRE62651.1 hypothetical protein [Ferruginibacter sp.]